MAQAKLKKDHTVTDERDDFSCTVDEMLIALGITPELGEVWTVRTDGGRVRATRHKPRVIIIPPPE